MGDERHRPPEEPHHPDDCHQQPEAIVRRRAQMNTPHPTNDQPTSICNTVPEGERTLLGSAGNHPEAKRERRDQERGASPDEGRLSDRDRSFHRR